MYRKLFCLTIMLTLLSAWPVAAQSKGQPDKAVLLKQAQTAMRANQTAQAAELFEAVLRIDPADVESHVNLGVIDFYRGDFRAASQQLHAALVRAPEMTKAQALLAICERHLGDPQAGVHLEQALAGLKDADPKMRVQVGIELADFRYQAGDLAGTAEVLHTLAEAAPDNVDVLFFEQRVYSELADGTLNKLALLAPGSARMEQLIAERLINMGDLPHAIVHYRKALALNPRLPGMHYELAESLMEDKPNDTATQKQALAELDAAASSDGDSAQIECQRGHIAMLQSMPDAALEHYRTALKLSPGDPQAEIGTAELLRQQNHPEEAAALLRKAVATDPMNAEAHYKLSQIARQLHLDEEQKRELKIFLDIRETRARVKDLYREMNSAPAGPAVAPGSDAAPAVQAPS